MARPPTERPAGEHLAVLVRMSRQLSASQKMSRKRREKLQSLLSAAMDELKSEMLVEEKSLHKPCKSCGAMATVRAMPDGHVHAARIDCEACGGFQWMKKAELKRLEGSALSNGHAP